MAYLYPPQAEKYLNTNHFNLILATQSSHYRLDSNKSFAAKLALIYFLPADVLQCGRFGWVNTTPAVLPFNLPHMPILKDRH
jgi:hypothetical protein